MRLFDKAKVHQAADRAKIAVVGVGSVDSCMICAA